MKRFQNIRLALAVAILAVVAIGLNQVLASGGYEIVGGGVTFGTKTDTKICTYSAAIDGLVCNTDTSGTVAGNDTEMQFNDGGSFGAEAAFTYNKTTNRLTVEKASTTLVTATTIWGSLQGSATDLTCTDCIGTTEIADSYVLNTGDTLTGNMNLDDGSGDSPTFQFKDGNDVTTWLYQEATDGFYIYSQSAIDIKSNGDTDDYIIVSTSGSVPEINAEGANLKITADGGTIDFDNENLTTTGKLTATYASSTGITATSFWGTLYGAVTSDSSWTSHNSYPAACSAGEYVSAIGDTLTCSTPAGGGDFTLATWYATTSKLNLNVGSVEGVDYGTLTDTKICTYDSSNTEIDCNTDAGAATAAGDTNDVQYNAADALAGENVFTYNPSTNRLAVQYASSTGITATSFWGTLYGSATDLTCTDCINATEIADVYALNTGDTLTGNLTLNDGSGDSPILSINSAGEAFSIQAENGIATQILSGLGMNFKMNNDTDDYIIFSTSGNVPEINGQGANLKITADGGTIDFDNEALTTTGKLTTGYASTTAITATSIWGALYGTASNASAVENVDLGTLTDTKICTYDLANTEIDCATDAGAATAAGADNEIQYNISDALTAEAAFTYNQTTNRLAVTYASTTGITATSFWGTLYGSATDLTCTDCINATEIEDVYLLTAGDSMTGKLTMTYASSTAITSTLFYGSLQGSATDLTCTDCINATEIEDIYILAAGDSMSGKLTMTNASSTNLTVSGTIWGTLQGSATDLTCTDCINATEIEDLYLLNNGDVGTGNYDFGGADFLEIPNGTGPTCNDPGEICHDTSDNQLVVDDYIVGRGVDRIWSVTVASTSQAFISAGLLKVPTELDGYTITAIRCSVQGGTSKVIAVEDESTNSTEDITCAASVTSDDGSITNAAVTAAEEMYIDFGATSGTVHYVSISVFGTWTRE